MSDTITCPICESENPADAINCEVCGERLAPLGEGEELDPSQNVSAMLEDDGRIGGSATHEDDLLDTGADIDLDDDVRPSFASGPSLEDSDVQEDDALHEADDDGETFEAPDTSADLAEFDAPDTSADARPDILYSSLDGRSYERGTPEWEEGFGPLGEELVPTPPDHPVEVATAEPTSADEEDTGAGFDYDDEFSASPAEDNDHNLEVAARPEAARSGEFRAAFAREESQSQPTFEPLPTPGVYSTPARVTIYVNRQPALVYDLDADETLIGRRDPIANAFPDLDLTDFDPQGSVSRRHAYIYRQNRNYTLYVISNAGTQLNSELLHLGDRRPIEDGDVIVLAGILAMKFEAGRYEVA